MDAGQTVDVDIKKLRDEQVKDVLGNVIPLSVTAGQLAWYGRALKGEFIGRLVEYNPITAVSSSFSCVQNCLCTTGFHSGSMTPGIIDGFADDSFLLDALETDADCNDANQFTYEIYNPEFVSSNTDVVTISGHTATLIDQGSANISVSWDAFTVTQNCTALASDGECVDARCPASAVATPEDDTEAQAARKPDHLKVGNDLIGSTSCGGIKREIDYVVVDNHTPPRPVGNISLIEDPDGEKTDSCSNKKVVFTTSCSPVVNSAGIFADTLQTGCPATGGSCGWDAPNDKWKWCNGTLLVPLATLNYSVHYDQVKVNGRATAWPEGTEFR